MIKKRKKKSPRKYILVDPFLTFLAARETEHKSGLPIKKMNSIYYYSFIIYSCMTVFRDCSFTEKINRDSFLMPSACSVFRLNSGAEYTHKMSDQTTSVALHRFKTYFDSLLLICTSF